MLAANSAVSAPITATVVLAAGACAYSGAIRQVTYTPAVTIVAAWISADTGVGPAIASGNHTWSGTWALLPTAPANSSRAIAVAASFVKTVPAVPKTTSKSSVPNRKTISASPISISVSPILVVMNAFFAASALPGTSDQNPINRYEHNPTPSHPRYSTR